MRSMMERLNSPEGQGEWWGTARAKTITVVTALVSPVITLALILFDAGKHVQIYEGMDISQWRVFRHAADGHSFFYFPFISEHPLRHWPTQLNWLRSVRSIQTDRRQMSGSPPASPRACSSYQ